MTQTRTWSHGSFHWNELMTRDIEKAKKFYGDVIGWTFNGMAMRLPKFRRQP